MWTRFAIVAVIAAAIVFPLFVTVNYFIHLAILAMIFMIVAQGANVIQGYTGYVSIAQGAFMGIGAYASALLSMRAGFPVWLSMLVAPVITAVAAAIAGYPSLRVKGHYFAIVTLAMNMVVFTVLVNWISLTKGEPGLPSIPSPEAINLGFIEIAFEKRRAYYYLALAALVLVMWIVAAVCGRGSAGCCWRSARMRPSLKLRASPAGSTSCSRSSSVRRWPVSAARSTRTTWASSIRRRSRRMRRSMPFLRLSWVAAVR